MIAPPTAIASNLQSIRQRIEGACRRAHRPVTDVRLIAVTKYAQPEWVHELVALGELDLGESRPQQLFDRAPQFHEPVRWHLIGSLQRNKVRRVLPLVDLIHSVDSLRLLEAIDRIAEELQIRSRVLLEVNVSGEEAKHGFTPDDIRDNFRAFSQFRNVEICGLMTMAPFADDPEAARPVFRELAKLRNDLSDQFTADLSLRELSMGMSNDFEVAIEEGATMIRVGSDLFRGLESLPW